MADTFPSPGSPGSPVCGMMRIPKDQAKLLDKADSWITSLESSNSRLGLVNLPADMLTSLTNFHRKRHQNHLTTRDSENSRKRGDDRESGKPQESESGQASTPAGNTPEAGATRSPEGATEEGARVSTTDDDSHQLPESSPGTPICSWPPSPNRDREISLQRRLSRETSPTPVQVQPPTSSLDLEEELEVVAPRGVRDTARTINQKTASPIPASSPSYTVFRPPPCGQGETRLTDADDLDEEPEGNLEAELEHMENPQEVVRRRPRRMQLPVFSSDPVNLQPTAHLHDNRFATSRIPPGGLHLSVLDSSQASVSGKDTSSSPAKDSPTFRGEPSGVGKRPNPQSPDPDLNNEPSFKRPRTSHDDESIGGAASQEVLVPATPSEQYPYLFKAGRILQPVRPPKLFDLYRKRYPKYRGTLVDFIRACICLEYLQQQDLMRDLLYDDFIHAFAGGYVSYVAKSPVDPLPAHRWFNRLGGQVNFDKMVITRDNLGLVFDAYPEEFRTIKSDQSPERPATSRTPHLRRGSAQEALTQLRQATTPTPEGLSEQRAPATLPRASRVAPEPRPSNETPNRYAEVIPRPKSPATTSSQTPAVIPATQSSEPGMPISQGPGLESIQGHARTIHPQTPHSVVAESPLRRVVTPQDQPRGFLPLHGHPFSDADSRKWCVSAEEGDKLAITKVTSLEVIPVGIQGNSSTIDSAPAPTAVQTPKKTKTGLRPKDVDNRHDRPSVERGTSHRGGSNSGSTDGSLGRDSSIVRTSHPSPRVRGKSTTTEYIGTRDSRLFEGRHARSPDLHSSAYTSVASPEADGPGNGLTNTIPALIETPSTRKESTGARTKEIGTRRSRHSIATGNPRASSGNDTLRKTASGRVEKETGRKSLGSKNGHKETDRKSLGGKSGQKKRRMTREEAMREFMKKKQVERATASPASRS